MPGDGDEQGLVSRALIAATLLAWLRLLALDGPLASAEPKTLRYRILHAAARITRGARRRQLKSGPAGAVQVVNVPSKRHPTTAHVCGSLVCGIAETTIRSPIRTPLARRGSKWFSM